MESTFDITKAIKLERGANEMGSVPDGYTLITFTLYTPEEYTGEEKASFRLEGNDPQQSKYDYFGEPEEEEDAAVGEEEEATSEIALEEEESEEITFSLVYQTADIDYYLQDNLPDEEIPHRSKENYTLSQLASDILEFLKQSDMELLLNTSSNLFVGKDHKDSDILDLDHNHKLNVLICHDPDSFSGGYVTLDDIANQIDRFYLNVYGLKTYVEEGYKDDFLESNILDTFVHEYTHIAQNVVSTNFVANKCFIIEGFASTMTAIVNHVQDSVHLPAYMSDTALFFDSFQHHPKDDDWGFLNYAIGGRFWYYLYLTHHLDEPFPYLNTIKEMLTVYDVEQICQDLARKDFKELYREFFLSVLAGNGFDFGPEITPFSASEEIEMDNYNLLCCIYGYYLYHYPLERDYNPYHYEDTPLDIQDLPGCSFIFAEWDQCPRTFVYTPSDDNVETWVFALEY